MGILDETRFIERQQFFDGQRLLADDLQYLEAFHREMRELHNRSLHQPGIGSGFAVTGEPGDREVTVGPGYALDAEGHEIVLTREQDEPVPPVAGGDDGESAYYHLTVSYPADDDLEEAETRSGLCQTHGTVRLQEEPVFCWVRLRRESDGVFRPADDRLKSDIDQGLKIVLALVEVKHCQLQSISIAQRRNARPATQPRMVCGRSRPTDWNVQFLESANEGIFVLSGTVDTSAAAFETTPCYFARIHGDRRLSAVVHGEPFEFFVDGLVRIEAGADSPRPDGFAVTIRLFTFPQFALGTFSDPTEPFLAWQIEWMGIE